MRKIFLAVAAMAMLATACTKDDSAVVGNESLVSFSVSSPELATRYGEGSEATDLYYAFYEVKNDGTHSILSDLSATTAEKAETLVGGKATINVPLVEGRTYAAIFWAQAEDAPYTIDWGTQKMSYDANVDLTVNNEDYDAFYAYYPVTVEKTHKVSLTRPFAQINIATAEEDYNNAVKAGLTATQTKVVVKGVCTSFDLINGEVNGEEKAELTFGWANVAECEHANCTGKKEGYKNLAMNYVLVADRRLVTVEMYVNDEDVKRTYTTVPVERNYRTYILGNLLTTTNNFEVETNPDWDDTLLPETEAEKLALALQVGGVYTLTEDVVLKAPLTLVNNVEATVNLNGHNITYTNPNESAYTAVFEVKKGILTIEGEGNVVAQGKGNIAVWAGRGDAENNGKVIIKGGNFSNNSAQELIYTINKGVVEIYGGTFQVAEEDQTSFAAPQYAVLNLYGNGKTGNDIILYGGTFHNFNPSDNVSENPKKNFCAEGFATYDNGDGTYTVLPALTAALKDVTTDTTVEVTTDMHVVAGTTPHTQNATANITINGNGHSVISTAESVDDFQWEGGTIPAMSTIFSSVKGSNATVTVNDLSFEGTMSALMLGHYVDSSSNWYNTVLNNVNVVDTEVVSFSSNVSPAVCVYGTAVLNNCNIYGTTLSELDTDPMWPVYDVVAVNYTDVTVNNSTIGSFYMWNQAKVTIAAGTEVETIVVRGNMNTTKYGLTIKAGAKVDAIDLSAIADKNKVNITIEDGATIGKVVANGVEYSSLNSYLNINDANTAADADTLVEALQGGKDVILTSNVKIDPANMSNAYGTTGINVTNGQTIDGGGHTLDIQGAGGTWDSGINTTGGLITNLTVTGSFRGIFINHNSTHSEPVVLENVILDGTVYTISCDQGLNQTLKATNSTFKGWTSYAATIGEVSFTNCYFGEGRGYAFCRPYAPTVFEGCEFEAGFTVDPVAAVTFKNCTLNGVLLTSANITELVTNAAKVTVENN